MRILISAYACEPNSKSEPYVGWNIVNYLSEKNELIVITRLNNKEKIENHLKSLKKPENIKWIYFDLPYWLKFWKKGKRGIRFYYYLWQIGIYFKIKKLISKTNIDIIHHITFVKYWVPSFLVLLPKPFIWGPVGGGEKMPINFYRELTLKGVLFELFREIAKKLSEFDPFLRITIKNSAFIFAANSETKNKLVSLGGKNVILLSQIGINDVEKDLSKRKNYFFREKKSVIFISIGNLLPLKGFYLSLKAFDKALPKLKNSEYWIIGDGPEKRRLEKFINKRNLNTHVKMFGALSKEIVFDLISKSDVLVFPSLHDSGGFVVAEAMIAKKPVICLDIGGPAMQVTKETGFKIPLHNPIQVINDIANAMIVLFENSELRRQMGEAGYKRISEHFHWEQKIKVFEKIYKQVLET